MELWQISEEEIKEISKNIATESFYAGVKCTIEGIREAAKGTHPLYQDEMLRVATTLEKTLLVMRTEDNDKT